MNTLREALPEYLRLRRSLGFKLEDAGLQLPRFVAFVEEHGSTHITNALALAWAQQSASVQPAEWARRLGSVRGFARYRSATDALTEVPPLGLLPHRSTRARPYLYSDDDVQHLLDAALKLPTTWHSTPLHPWVFHCLFGLLSTTGMRISEALNLHVADVDLDQALLTIRGAKLGKTRLVPLHATTGRVLADYLRRRQAFFARPISPYYQAGEDAARLLPVLSAYIGHVRVQDTYWYLSAWPELMAQAMSRLERRWEAVP